MAAPGLLTQKRNETRWTRRSVLGGIAAGAMLFPSRSGDAQITKPDLSHLPPEQRTRYEQMHDRMMAALKFERITVPGDQALAEWERQKASGRGWPVVVGGDEDLERIADQFSMSDPTVSGGAMPGVELRSPEEILAKATAIKFPDDLRKWPGAYQPEDLRAPVGDWPATVQTDEPGLSVSLDLISGATLKNVHLLLIPVKSGWEVPAYLRWGDWNACPPPEYHVAALRLWHDRYGADLVGINGDTMNLRAARSPSSREEAIALAREQYRYCPDIIDQGVGSISALAAALMSSPWWYLWWD